MFSGMRITFQLPPNDTYYVSNPTLNFEAVGPDNVFLHSEVGPGGGSVYSGDFFYALDNQSIRSSGVKIENCHMESITENDDVYHVFSGHVSLPVLEMGAHNITICWGVWTHNGITTTEAFSDTGNFYVASPGSSNSLYLLSGQIVAVAVVAIILTALALLLVRKDRINTKLQSQ
jgi:hypothetical protein